MNVNEQLHRVLGDIADCAVVLNCSNRTVYNVIKTDPTFPLAIEVRPGMPRRFLDEVVEWARKRPRVNVAPEPTQMQGVPKVRKAPEVRRDRRASDKRPSGRKSTRQAARRGA